MPEGKVAPYTFLTALACQIGQLQIGRISMPTSLSQSKYAIRKKSTVKTSLFDALTTRESSPKDCLLFGKSALRVGNPHCFLKSCGLPRKFDPYQVRVRLRY